MRLPETSQHPALIGDQAKPIIQEIAPATEPVEGVARKRVESPIAAPVLARRHDVTAPIRAGRAPDHLGRLKGGMRRDG